MWQTKEELMVDPEWPKTHRLQLYIWMEYSIKWTEDKNVLNKSLTITDVFNVDSSIGKEEFIDFCKFDLVARLDNVVSKSKSQIVIHATRYKLV